MAENLYLPSSQSSKSGTNDFYILARAVRKDDQKSKISASSVHTFKSQSDTHPQSHHGLRYVLTFSSRSTLHPNIIVSKPATRKSVPQNNAALFDGIDLSKIRNSKLFEPPWREKEANRKSLQSAYLHNKRKIEEIQAMKAKMKYPRYGPGDFSPLCIAETNTRTQQKQQNASYLEKFSQPYDCYQAPPAPPQSKPLVMESENPLPDDFSDDEQVANGKEKCVYDGSNPIIDPTQEKFVWNPVILPNPKLFKSAWELLESPYSSQFHGENASECFDSPGNHTTSSSSTSYLTVAEEEETVKFTCFMERLRVPTTEQTQSRRDVNHRYVSLYDPRSSYVEEWQPHTYKPDSYNHFEE